MLDVDKRVGGEELQFDRVVTESTSSAPPSKLAAFCAVCQTSIETAYFDVNGSILCRDCCIVAQSAAQTHRGIVPLVTASVFGLGAGVVGAAIYYAVMAIANLEIGIVAILIGYMVGYAVRKGARGRGARRYQVLAVALTYASIALAYAPIAVRQVIDANGSAQSAESATTGSNSSGTAAVESERPATTEPTGRRAAASFASLAVLIAALPVIVVLGSLPSGLISAFIIFIGMRQAWRMTGAPLLQIRGPFRVGAAPATSA
jgi:hypothetical protein